MITHTTIKAMLNNTRSRNAIKSAIIDVFKRGYSVAPILNKNGAEVLTVSVKQGKLCIVDRKGVDHSGSVFNLQNIKRV